ncbi:MAG TPA: hypothetical protein VFI31_17785 [Pirellulales bacterium]|nr:hypothetical protein [Pirellulales bacterium]
MNSVKETKELLGRVRRELDEELRAKVEPILREILDVAKPKTVTQIEYRHDPEDQAAIESLRAALLAQEEQASKLRFKAAAAEDKLRKTIAAQGDELETLRSRLKKNYKGEIASLRETIAEKEKQLRDLPRRLAKLQGPQLRPDATVDELLLVVDKMAHQYMQCIIKCICVARAGAKRRQKKQILLRLAVLANTVLATYLNQLESFDQVDGKKLKRIIDDNSVNALRKLADELRAELGVEVDLELNLNGREHF